MLHLKNTNYTPKDAKRLLQKARDSVHGYPITVRDCRVSSQYIEFDVSINSKDLEQLIQDLRIIGELDHPKHVVEEDIPKEDAINDGIFYFNNERFWECHEVLEGVWKTCYEGEKDLVQGIILVAAALVHFQKNENDICLSIFKRALNKLSHSSGMYHKIDVDKLRKKVTSMIDSQQISTFAI